MAIENLAIKITAIQAGGAVLRALENRLGNMANASEKIKENFRQGTKFIQAGATAAVVTKALAKNIGKGVKEAANLEESMKGLKKELIGPNKSLQQVNKELSEIQETAFSIQKETPFDQKAVVEQATILRKAGLDVKAITSGALEATAKLATVEGMNPETAASISAVADATFDLANKTDGFTHFADLMSRSTSLANFEVEDFGEALKYAGGNAKRLNLNSREVAISIASLAKDGLKGSQAGTTLSSIFRDLEKRRPDLVFDKLTGKAKPLADILKGLNSQFEGLTDQQRSKKLSKIFGDEAKKGVGALLTNYKNLNGELDKQASLQSKVDVILEGFNRKVDSLKGTSKSVVAKLFEPALDPLSKLVDKANEFVGAIGEMTKGENKIGKIVSKASLGAVVAGGTGAAVLTAIGVNKIGSSIRGSGGLKGLFSKTAGTAAGVAKGKALESASGVTPVFVVNANEIGSGIPGIPGSTPGKTGGGVLKSLPFIATIGALQSKYGGFTDFQPAINKKLEDNMNSILREARFRTQLAGKLNEARNIGDTSEQSRLIKAFTSRELQAGKSVNDISIAINALTGQTSVSANGSDTKVSTEIKPILD